MTKRTAILILLYLSSFYNGLCQVSPYCGTDDYQVILSQDPVYQSQIQNQEKQYRSYIKNPIPQSRNNEVSIPVVFHVIHNNGPENITDTQIQQVLAHLNEAFANEGSYINEDGVDTKIRFCFAQRDGEGNDFSGILRHESPYTDMSIFEGFEYVKSRKVDSTSYINIQIVQKACLGSNCNVAGFAGEYRIVIEANTLDETASEATVFIHEMGHYLGLKHTFHGGCKNDNCLEDGDKVCDTPPDNRTFDGCTIPSNSCFTDEDDPSINNPYRPMSLSGLGDQPDDQVNFMDYNFRSCREKFTQGQADRMFFFLENRYAGLLSSKGCLLPCETVVIADFELPDSVEVGGTLLVANQSINADSYQWFVNGNPVSTTLDYTHTFLDIGTIIVQLEAYTNDTLCETSTMVKPITVYCPVEACFDYTINGQYLILDDCSTNANMLEFIVINDKDTIDTTAESLDSVYVNNIDFVKVCLTARGEHCSDVHCEYITITTDGSEICGNEQDDDGDGLIDLFDPDCPCNDIAYQAQCPPVCEIVPDSFPDIKMKMKWESEIIGNSTSNIVLGDVNNDNEISILTTKTIPIDLFNEEVFLVNVNGRDGSTNFETRINEDQRGQVAIGNINFDSAKVFYALLDNISNYSSSLNLELNSDNVSNPNNSSINLADLNGDGTAELIKGTSIYNAKNGKLLIDGPLEGGCNFGTPCVTSVVSVGDLTESSGLELAAGNTVFEIELTNLEGLSGNTATPINAETGIFDGFTSIGDINGDGTLDVISVRSNTFADGGGVFIWSPRSTELIAKGNAGQSGGVAFLGDVDNDCSPEIGIAFKNELRLYKYDGTKVLQLVWQIPTSDNSGRTGGTMFDFNQDGKLEIIYRDETHLKIIEGVSGFVLDSVELGSITGRENPIIADVDNDGEAEILISGTVSFEEESRLYCFESASIPWAPARSVWNQYAYNPTQVNDDLTIPRYQQNAAQRLQGTENCPRETCNTPYNNFMVQATYRTQEGCYVWPELQRDLTISAESRCIGDSLEICFYTSSTDTTVISQGVTINCYPPPWDEGNGVVTQSIDEIVVTTDTTCIMMSMLTDIDSLLIVVNDEGGYYPPDFPNTDITECDYTNNEFVLQLGDPDFSIDIIDWDCSSDSLIFYIATDNVGLDTDVSCIGGGCYFTDPSIGSMNGVVVTPIEYTNWCFDFDTTSMTYQYQDTFRVATPYPVGQSQMWWTINEGGFGPGLLSSAVTGIYECNYSNNTDSIAFDISEKMLDLGPDIIKCSTEVFTLNAGVGFESYLWNDLTTDSIYSAIAEGIHFIEAIDQCGRVYRDTIIVTIDDSEDIDLGADIQLCYDQDTVLTITGAYDEVYWSPTDMVVCDTCMSTMVNVDTMITLYVQARNGNCMSYDTIVIERILPELDTLTMSSCIGDTIDFFDQVVISDGLYEHLSLDCSRLDVLEAIFTAPDTIERIEQICSSDSILFDGQYLSTQGNYVMTIQNILGCDSTIVLDLEVVNELAYIDTLYICENDSTLVFGEWILNDTTVTQSLLSSAGCDSLLTISVVLNSLPRNDMQFQVCEGDSVLLYGEWYRNDGYYNAIVPNNEGCDSLISLEIITKENFTTYDTITACQGDTIQVFATTLTSSEDLWESYVAENGCDSVSYYHVKFVDELESSEEIMLCPGDSIIINGAWIYEEGEYKTVQTSVIGCDSIHSVYITMISYPPTPETEIDCEDLEIIVSIDAQSEWNPIWSNGDTTNQTVYASGNMDASLMLYTQPNCEKQFTITLPQLPKIDDIPSILDTILTKDQSISIDLELNPNEWSVKWNDASIVDCDTCMTVQISPTENTEITIYLEHQSGCTFESSFLINLEEEVEGIYVPNIFSPNNDNNNDSWSVFSTSNIQITACNVYDRWGNLVYNIKGDLPEWDGKFNGRKVEQGVYVYMIRYIDSEGKYQIKIGDVTLIR